MKFTIVNSKDMDRWNIDLRRKFDDILHLSFGSRHNIHIHNLNYLSQPCIRMGLLWGKSYVPKTIYGGLSADYAVYQLTTRRWLADTLPRILILACDLTPVVAPKDAHNWSLIVIELE